ncbi:MAG: hypothetical protein HYT72_05265 [Candidatus Aenigmarchaeota archaeon]|nr:hypothetical protein [Candidatus Aenigmarchaeota archaeon]
MKKRGIKIRIVKRRGHLEEYDQKKVYGSCYGACYATGLTAKECEAIAEAVAKEASRWVKSRQKVTSTEIFRFVVKLLKKHNKEVAFLYETHRDIS